MRFAFVLLVFGALAGPASAGTVEVRDQPVGEQPFGANQKQVVFEDTDAVNNAVEVSYTYTQGGPAAVTVSDGGPAPVAGSGCASVPGAVRCEVESLGRIDVFLGPGELDTARIEVASETSCACAWLWGGEGRDFITSQDATSAYGQAGDDALGAWDSRATLTPTLLDPDRNVYDGGPGNDEVNGSNGDDVLEGGPGEDTVRGQRGNDRLSGGYLEPKPAVEGPAGRDRVDGGEGSDELTDGDVIQDVDGIPDYDEVGPDQLTGSTGEDILLAYRHRTEPLLVDISSLRAGDGQANENDVVRNVETVFGGRGIDRLIGDGDANFIFPQQGNNYVAARGGDDFVSALGSFRQSINTNRGDDRIKTVPWARGPFDCGPGRDRLDQRRSSGGRQPDVTRNFGPTLRRNCEALSRSFVKRAWALRPVATTRGRTLRFARASGARHRSGQVLTLTEPQKPFERIRRARVRRDGVTIRLSRAQARVHLRRGELLRAAVTGQNASTMIWRFEPAR
jgi:hypothetical protein